MKLITLNQVDMDTNSQDFILPQHEGLTGSTVVESGSNKTKNPNKTLLPPGLNAGRIVQVCDLGTHLDSYQGSAPEPKRKLRIAFEHSHLKQKYYLEDDRLSPAMTSKEVTFVFSEKSWIKQLLDLIEGRNLSIDEAKSYPLHKLLGRTVGVHIIHQETKDKSHFYEKITSVVAWSETSNVMPQNWSPEMDLHYFFIDMQPSGELIGANFASKTFANLPYYVRKSLFASQEAVEYKARGGKFAQNPKQEDSNTAPVQNQGPSQPFQNKAVALPSSPDGTMVLEMIKTQYTYEQYINNQWTVNDMIADGAARWVAVEIQGPPAPVQQQGPPAPMGQHTAQPPVQDPVQNFQDDGNEMPF